MISPQHVSERLFGVCAVAVPQTLVSGRGQKLVDALKNDHSPAAVTVRSLIDVAHHGNLDKFDNNWSDKDVIAAAEGRNLLALVGQWGFGGRRC